jgi:hypothetical protein
MKNRQVVKYGSSWFIRLAPIDMKDYSLQDGDMIDLESALMLHQTRISSASSDPHNKQKLQNISKKKEVKK